MTGMARNRVLASCAALSMLLMLFHVQLCADDFRSNAVNGAAETFGKGDEPYAISIGNDKFSTPYGYDREKSACKYPLVVIGKWGSGNKYFDDGVRKKYPAFYLSFPYSEESDGVRLAGIIDEALSKGLRIDVNRILYTGFSAGGSGSFKLVKGLASKGKYFAGLNRIAGQSQNVLPDAAAERTMIWLHIGLKDTPLRVEVSRQLYQNLKSHPINAGAEEKYVSDTVKDVDGHTEIPRNTWILIKNGVEVVRYSEYPTCAHNAWIGYSDVYMFEWIFTRKILE